MRFSLFTLTTVALLAAASSCSSDDDFEVWREGNLEQVKTQVEAFPNKNDINNIVYGGDQDEFQTTALDLAVYGNTADVVAYLLEQGADPNRLTAQAQPLLVLATLYNPDPRVTSLLIEYGIDVDQRDEDGNSALQQALTNKVDAEIVAALLKAGLPPVAPTFSYVKDYGDSALLFAIGDDCKPSVAQVLIDAGADLEHRNKEGETALLVAAHYSHRPAVIKLLLDAGANLEATTADKKTALMLAVEHSVNPLVLDALLDAGADVQAEDRSGRRAMDCVQVEGFSNILDSKAYERLRDATEIKK